MSMAARAVPEPEPAGEAADPASLPTSPAGEAAEETEGAAPDSEELEAGGPTRQARAPWHFKVILVGSVVYLGWRAYQGISWLAHHIH